MHSRINVARYWLLFLLFQAPYPQFYRKYPENAFPRGRQGRLTQFAFSSCADLYFVMFPSSSYSPSFILWMQVCRDMSLKAGPGFGQALVEPKPSCLSPWRFAATADVQFPNLVTFRLMKLDLRPSQQLVPCAAFCPAFSACCSALFSLDWGVLTLVAFIDPCFPCLLKINRA